MDSQTKTYRFTGSIIRGYSCMGGSCWANVNFEVELSDDHVAAIRDFYKNHESECAYTELKDAYHGIFEIFDEALREVFDMYVGPGIGFDAEFFFPAAFLSGNDRDTDYTEEFEDEFAEEEFEEYFEKESENDFEEESEDQLE